MRTIRIQKQLIVEILPSRLTFRDQDFSPRVYPNPLAAISCFYNKEDIG